MLNIQHLTKTYSGKKAVDDLSLHIAPGEIYGFIGHNGAGKTTLFRILTGELDYDEGQVMVAPDRRVGLISQIPVYPDGYTVEDVLRSAFERMFRMKAEMDRLTEQMAAGDSSSQTLKRYGELTARFEGLGGYDTDTAVNKVANGLSIDTEMRQRLFDQLSGGEKTRVNLGRLILEDTDILLLDEPLGALDLKLRKEMQLELKRLQREMNITFIYVTHDQEEALTMSDTVVVMNGGKVQQIGTPEDIYNEPKNAFVADFIGDSNIVDGVMHRDFLVSFSGVEFPCVDRGFAREQSVQVVVRPEDIEVVSPMEGQLVGVVNDVIFKGVHFEMHVECEGREWLIHSTRACTPGETIGMKIGPNEIHIMARS